MNATISGLLFGSAPNAELRLSGGYNQVNLHLNREFKLTNSWLIERLRSNCVDRFRESWCIQP